MSDEDQIYFQALVATKGKIAAIKGLRVRFPGSLKASKDAIEMLLDAVKPALIEVV